MSNPMDPATAVNTDEPGTAKKLDDLYRLIEGIQVCMMTTRCSKTGQLVSRAMTPCKTSHETPADLCFISNNTTHKFEELRDDPNVNLAFLKPNTREWVSVSGKAQMSQDREKIKKVYHPDLQMWFGDLKDGKHDGSVNDPRISLILVTAESVHYSFNDTSMPVQLWHIMKSLRTGEPPKVQAQRTIDAEELQHGRNIKKLDNTVVDF